MHWKQRAVPPTRNAVRPLAPTVSSRSHRPSTPALVAALLTTAAAAVAAALTGGNAIVVGAAALGGAGVALAIASRLYRASLPAEAEGEAAPGPDRDRAHQAPQLHNVTSVPQRVDAVAAEPARAGSRRQGRATPAVTRTVAETAPAFVESPSGAAAQAQTDVVVASIPSPPEPSLRDPATGLATRALFRDRLTRALLRAQRHRSQVAVFLLDIAAADGSTVDDDQLLDAIARRLATWLRATDSAARVAGHRFALLLEDLGDTTDFATAAHRVARLFASPLVVEGQSIPCSAFIGVAMAYPEDDAEQLIHHAGVALRDARRRDRGAVELFDPGRHAGTLAHRDLEAELRRALEHGEMTLLYQPIVYLRSRRIAGVEALVRWQHRERGIVPAAAFVPVAEATGLIVPLGRWVLREACRQLREWHDVLGDRPLTLTVNISARQLDDPEFARDVAAVVRETGIDPRRLVLEIAERVLARGSPDALWRLRDVRGLGVRLAVDDFGARSGSFGDPADIPVDILKIDRAFVSQVARRPEDHAATRAIVALGRLKQLRTVAPGIEREEQLVELLSFHCEYGQGTLFSDPIDADAMLRLLQRE